MKTSHCMFQVNILWLPISKIHFANPHQIDMLPEPFLFVEQSVYPDCIKQLVIHFFHMTNYLGRLNILHSSFVNIWWTPIHYFLNRYREYMHLFRPLYFTGPYWQHVNWGSSESATAPDASVSLRAICSWETEWVLQSLALLLYGLTPSPQRIWN